MPGIGGMVVGALAVFALIVGWLLVEGRRTYRRREARRASLGMVRVTSPDPALAARILSAFPAGAGDRGPTLGGLERVSTDQPGTWYVAMVKQVSGGSDDAPEPAHVLLVIDGLAQADAWSEPVAVPGADNLWTRRAVSGLLLVEGVAGAGDAVRDFERMKDAGVRAVAAAQAP